MNDGKQDVPEPRSGAVKLTFLLTDDQAGPFPVATETLWCRPEGDYYRIRNVPFFIDGISYDDVISIHIENDLCHVESIVVPSTNSTIWIYLRAPQKRKTFLDSLPSLGCGVEGGVLNGYYAINVPGGVDIDPVYTVIAKAKDNGYVAADYSSIRHNAENAGCASVSARESS